jgi:Histidine kinase-like ATPase domain
VSIGVSGPSAAQAIRVLRVIEAECRSRDDVETVADLLTCLVPGLDEFRLGVVELLLNAIEHGNLEIGGAHKTQLLREGRFEAEIADRLDREPYRSRRARATLLVAPGEVTIEISDDGQGFAWREALAADLAAVDTPNGRGVALARQLCFPSLTYREPGNVAIIRVPWRP